MFGYNDITGKRFFREESDDRLLVTSLFQTLQGEGPYAGWPAFFVRLSYCQLNCHFCFPAHYTVTTNHGKKLLSDVKVGDKVITLGSDFAPTWTSVKQVISRWVDSDELLTITYSNNDGVHRNITCTKEHPFNIKNHGFVSAEKLKRGMVVHSLPSYAVTSFLMKQKNPMKNADIAARAGATRSQAFIKGTIKPYVRDRKWREAQSKRMQKKNPMFNMDARRRMITNKVYKKSDFEVYCHEILSKIVDNIQYVGNDKNYVIGNEERSWIRPDFAIKGTNKLFEVYDPSSPQYERKTKHQQYQYERRRREHYQYFGYDVEFIKKDELNWRVGQGSGKPTLPNPEAEKRFVEKVGKFVTNGATIIAVQPVRNKALSSMSRTGNYKNGKVKVVNLSCAPYNTYCMRGLHSHNCDTFFDTGDWFTIRQLDNEIDRRINKYFNNEVPPWADLRGDHPREMVLVITGGEPMLQTNITQFLDCVVEQFSHTQIETNGLVLQKIPPSTTLVVSPKCREVDGKPVQYFKPLPSILERANCLKFVMSSNLDSPYSKVPEWALATKLPIYISPMNMYKREPEKARLLREARAKGETAELTFEQRTDAEVISFWDEGLLDMQANRSNHEYAAQYALKHGHRLSLQMHLLASLA